MRPTRLELEGFTAFKEPTIVDFADTEYFALVGPTGSGKSTIIDAICFALYGLVPRYGSKTLVWPVITQGSLEAKVRLDFTVDGRLYTAVRVVKRAGTNRATTKEARLEHNGEVVAGTADELSAEVEKLLGLTFEHFTKCVGLPQGEFARFLHDKPAERQEVLVRLLNLGVYDRMRYLASSRAANRKNEVALRRQRIDEDFAFATDEALTEKKDIVGSLLEVREQVAEMTPKVAKLDEREKEATSLIESSRAAIELLSQLEVPDEIAGFSQREKAATTESETSEARLAELKRASKAAADERAALGDPAPLHSLIKTFDHAEALRERVKGFTAEVTAADKTAGSARKAASDADAEVKRATEKLEAARREHAAIHLAQGLKKGEPCPVCEQTVTTLPRHAPPADLQRAQEAVESASVVARTAHTEAAEAERRVAEARGGLAQLEKELESVQNDLADASPRKQVEKTLSAIAAADEALEAARRAEDSASDACEIARSVIKTLERERASATKAFHEARDAVAALTPPAATHDDVTADWTALVTWSKETIPALSTKIEESTKTIEVVAVERDSILRTIADACERCAVDLTDGDPKEAVASALARAKSDVERIQEALTGKAKLEQEAADLQAEHDLANSLAQHLSAKGFEKWIVNEALQRLVLGATTILRELSNEQYSLVVDATGNFLVKDHHNADETRLAKTLSGGETFLASLSLALALADQLVDLAAEGSARLESIFLDEGFGTLDAETLDTVAATVENLAARGRMVGIVTHVRELADRVPVQFRVTKDPRTSTVDKVSL